MFVAAARYDYYIFFFGFVMLVQYLLCTLKAPYCSCARRRRRHGNRFRTRLCNFSGTLDRIFFNVPVCDRKQQARFLTHSKPCLALFTYLSNQFLQPIVSPTLRSAEQEAHRLRVEECLMHRKVVHI